jgi:hypothetical protein
MSSWNLRDLQPIHPGGHLMRFSVLPVLTYYTYAALRFSKTTPADSPG